MADNVEKGFELALLIENVGATAFDIIGGITSRGVDIANATEETTNVTSGAYSERQSTLVRSVTVSGSGKADTRVGGTDPNTGLLFAGIDRLIELAFSDPPEANVKILNVRTSGELEGIMLIESCRKTGESPGVVSFELSMTNKGDMELTGVI